MDDEEALIRDVEKGLADSELMERYHLSAANLRRRLLQFIRDGAVSASYIYWRPILYDYEINDSDRRKAPRYPLKLLLPVSVTGSSEPISGLLIDINERGGCVRGISPSLGERVLLKIDPGTVCSGNEITLEVVFRWSESAGGDESVAGFEIVSASERDTHWLRYLISTIVHG